MAARTGGRLRHPHFAQPVAAVCEAGSRRWIDRRGQIGGRLVELFQLRRPALECEQRGIQRRIGDTEGSGQKDVVGEPPARRTMRL